ncbi:MULTISPECIES: hypothetical protein [unclassified Pseudomonas]|uniref:hypothetical protein n=1 Tax=unclassified Pseudomonas TaxID=196821 RepID=UPI00244AD9C9|nr:MULTISPECIES: hypothetical protein [unclassified Pseudomonas]MDG9928289.1 hypothetical protein [Pseudomonas sp. GD04042]MDH0481147.1 hypothetical protein [Pseudomonas sp. GD04015]MDH0604483.1 hypothetical protein [Pseudomonas sp. GD03869]
MINATEAIRMDAKSLEVLQQLKQSMEADKRVEQAKDWIEKVCRFCKATFVAHKDWKPQPIMCKGCRTERKTHYEVPEGDTLFTETRVFHGGGPGTGRRK